MNPTPGQNMTHHCAGCLRSTRHVWIEDHWICRVCQRDVHPRADACPECGMEMMAGASGLICVSCNFVSP